MPKTKDGSVYDGIKDKLPKLKPEYHYRVLEIKGDGRIVIAIHRDDYEHIHGEPQGKDKYGVLYQKERTFKLEIDIYEDFDQYANHWKGVIGCDCNPFAPKRNLYSKVTDEVAKEVAKEIMDDGDKQADQKQGHIVFDPTFPHPIKSLEKGKDEEKN